MCKDQAHIHALDHAQTHVWAQYEYKLAIARMLKVITYPTKNGALGITMDMKYCRKMLQPWSNHKLNHNIKYIHNLQMCNSEIH